MEGNMGGENEGGENEEYGMKKNELSSSKEELLKDRTSIRTFDKKLVCEDSDSSTKSWMLDDKIYEPDSSVANSSDGELPNTAADKLEELKSKEESKEDETAAETRWCVTRSPFIEEDGLTASAVVESKKESNAEDDFSSEHSSEMKYAHSKGRPRRYSLTTYSTSDEELWPFPTKRAKLESSLEDDLFSTHESEASICEVPIPPKPKPPTVYLMDSSDESSCASSATTDSETRLDKKSFLGRESGTRNKGNVSMIPGSGGAANNPKGKGRENMATPRDDDDVVMLEVVVETVRREAVDKSSDRSAASEKGGKRNGKEENLNRSSSNAGAERFLSATRQAALGMSDKNEASKTRENSSQDGKLILNVAEGHASTSRIGNDNGEGEGQARRRAGRKRSPGESGRKSASDGSPAKRARNFEDRAAPGTLKDHCKESRGKTRNRSADSFFKPMTREMEKFYNDSWGGENFDVDAIRRKMPADPRQWEISNEDLLNGQRRRSRYWTKMKCRNCNETGHAVAECTQQRKPPSCHMCGTSGHREPRCPNKHCLGCGTKQKTYTEICNRCRSAWCNGCQSPGHEDNNCPDLWRRYHQTTSLADINTDLEGTDVMKPRHLLNCSNCARRGHDASTCASYRWSRHFPTPAYVTNYKTGPAYAHDPPPETERPKSSESEKLCANDNGDQCSSSSLISRDNNHEEKNKKKRRNKKKRGDMKKKEDEKQVDEIASGVVDDPDSIVVENFELERDEEGSKDRDRSKLEGRDEGKKDSLMKTGTEIAEDSEIIHFTVTSDLFDKEYLSKIVIDTSTVRLTGPEFDYVAFSDVSVQFFENLITRFPVSLVLRTVCSKDMEFSIEMLIHSELELSQAIRLTIIGWLSLPAYERSRFVSLTLPTGKKDLVDILFRKLNELCEDLGDPRKIREDIRNSQSQLRSMQRQTRSGKTCGISPKRARVVEELANLQCRLNMILVGQSRDGTVQKSYNYLRTSLIQMMNSDSDGPVDDSVYLTIHHHYNKIFSAYTSDYTSRYSLKNWKTEGGRKIDRKRPIFYRSPFNVGKKGSKKSVAPNVTNEKSQNHFNEGMVKNIPSLVDPGVSFEKPGTKQGRYFNCNVIESRSPDNPPSIRRDSGNIDVDTNTNDTGSFEPNEHYRRTNNSTLSGNRSHQSDKDFGDNNASSSCKVRGKTYCQTTTGNNDIEEKDYISLTDNYDNRGLDWKRAVESDRDSFYSDLAAGCSSSKDSNSACDTEIALGIRFKDITPRSSKTTDNNNKRNTRSEHKDNNSNNNNNNNNKNKNNSSNSSKKNKRKRSNSTALPPYLQERAVANVEQYLKMHDPAVVRAVARLKKKFSNRNVTLRSVGSFEKLLARKTGMEVHLL